MKSLNDIYTEVMTDEDLRKEFLEASEAEKISEFLKAHGCEATIDEFDEFMKSAGGKSGELDDDELDNVAAGKKCGTVYKDGHPVVTIYNYCDHFRCKTCGRTKAEIDRDCIKGPNYAPKCHKNGANCKGCKFCECKKGLWLCLNEKRIND